MVTCEHLNLFVFPVYRLDSYYFMERLCLDCGTHTVDLVPFGYYQQECLFGHRTLYMSYMDSIRDNTELTCSHCGEGLYNLIPIEDVEEPHVIINEALGDLENANYHREGSLLSKAWGRLSAKYGSTIELAQILREVFCNS